MRGYGGGENDRKERFHGTKVFVPDPGAENKSYAYVIVNAKHISSDFPGGFQIGRLRYGEPNAVANAIDYAKHRSRSHRAVIRVYDHTSNVIEHTSTQAIYKEW